MKLLSTRNGLLLAAFFASLPHSGTGRVVSPGAIASKQNAPFLAHYPSPSNPHGSALDALLIRDEELLVPLKPRALPRPGGRPPTPPPPPPPPPMPPRPVGATRPPGVAGPAREPGSAAQPPGVDRPPRRTREATPTRSDPPSPPANWQPITDYAGMGQGVGAEPRPMAEYEKVGQEQLAAYQKAIDDRIPDTVIVTSPAELSRHEKNKAFLDFRTNPEYNVLDKTVALRDPELRSLKRFTSSELGFSMNEGQSEFLKKVVVWGPDPEKSSVDKPIFEATFDSGGKFIIYQHAFKENQSKLSITVPLNEVSMQSFLSASKEKSKEFKVAFIQNVQNKAFWEIVRQSYNDRKQPYTQILTFERGTTQFERIMGSPNFASRFFSFANHHNALGDKIPKRIVVAPKQTSEEVVKTLDVALIFEKAA